MAVTIPCHIKVNFTFSYDVGGKTCKINLFKNVNFGKMESVQTNLIVGVAHNNLLQYISALILMQKRKLVKSYTVGSKTSTGLKFLETI